MQSASSPGACIQSTPFTPPSTHHFACAGYKVQEIAFLFSFDNLWPDTDPALLPQVQSLVRSYWKACAPGNSNTWLCAPYSPTCAKQTYASGAH